MKISTDPYNVPSEREFAASMVMTTLMIVVIAVLIAASTTWFTTRHYETDIHHQAIRTAIFLPLVIVPLCTGIIGYQGLMNHRRMLAVSRLARTDEMTGLANRRSFMHHADAMFRDSDLDYIGVGIFIVDLDHFKQVNDVHGHDAGDEVLIHAARQIMLAAPEDSLVSRLGGEEFALLVQYVHVSELNAQAETIRKRIAATPCTYQNVQIRVSASIGIGIAHPRDTVSSVLSRADDALYEAKDLGRNRFVIAA
ncbi:MAG: GGDEF domain-containing protein [Pseudomonadota bacterium]